MKSLRYYLQIFFTFLLCFALFTIDIYTFEQPLPIPKLNHARVCVYTNEQRNIFHYSISS